MILFKLSKKLPTHSPFFAQTQTGNVERTESSLHAFMCFRHIHAIHDCQREPIIYRHTLIYLKDEVSQMVYLFLCSAYPNFKDVFLTAQVCVLGD